MNGALEVAVERCAFDFDQAIVAAHAKFAEDARARGWTESEIRAALKSNEPLCEQARDAALSKAREWLAIVFED